MNTYEVYLVYSRLPVDEFRSNFELLSPYTEN